METRSLFAKVYSRTKPLYISASLNYVHFYAQVGTELMSDYSLDI